MDIQNSNAAIERLLTQLAQKRNQQTQSTSTDFQNAIPPKKIDRVQDQVILSQDSARNKNVNSDDKSNANAGKGPNLISENIEDTEDGFRRTQEFENSNGNKFTRVEEVVTTPDRSTRTVIQQNESGSTTAFENVIDRQDDGSFRLIQRFTDETGETSTNVTVGFNPNDADVLLGRPAAPASQSNPALQLPRGSQVDITA